MKAAMLKRVLPPNNETIVSVSQDTGVAKATTSYWKKQAADGILERGDGPLRPSDRSSAEKLTLLLESRGVEMDQHGEWLRSHGLHSEHLPLWEQELRDIVTDKEKKQREELAELQRKDKALAETAALLALKKSGSDLGGRRGRLIPRADRVLAVELGKLSPRYFQAHVCSAAGCTKRRMSSISCPRRSSRAPRR
jgi:hypothetical protein